jgi:UDP-N-acetylmuramoyl-L-alanyl-D-glutamate--2,6-diaminopimelate ligase
LILQDLLYGINIKAVHGSTAVVANGLAIDSRKVQPGYVFIAIAGTITNGHTHISKAIELGAIAIICEAIPENLVVGCTYVATNNSALAAGIVAKNFFNNPSKHIKLVGVTGTNGKTTVATLLYNLFTALGQTCGLISTVEIKVGDTVLDATHTTPDVITLNELLSKMVLNGCTYVFMEVSSHAIHQHRIAGLDFVGAIFTNITHDHLDYHKTFDEYIRVKKSWFDNLPKGAFAITNADDKRGSVMLQNTVAKKVLYGLHSLVEVKGKILENSLFGLQLLVNEVEVHFKLIGAFNAYNLLAVYAAATQLGYNKEDVLQTLSNINGAAGRFDYLVSNKQQIIAIVDYAHTPDALENVLTTIKDLQKGGGKIISVVGCGGNRDTTKRPIMAKIACAHSDNIILTSDNPRNEAPEQIVAEMLTGVSVAAKRKVLSVVDRYEAIKTAITLAATNDIVLVAGKGHENYQEIMGVKHPFDDKAVVAELFKELEK